MASQQAKRIQNLSCNTLKKGKYVLKTQWRLFLLLRLHKGDKRDAFENKDQKVNLQIIKLLQEELGSYKQKSYYRSDKRSSG